MTPIRTSYRYDVRNRYIWTQEFVFLNHENAVQSNNSLTHHRNYTISYVSQPTSAEQTGE